MKNILLLFFFGEEKKRGNSLNQQGFKRGFNQTWEAASLQQQPILTTLTRILTHRFIQILKIQTFLLTQ